MQKSHRRRPTQQQRTRRAIWWTVGAVVGVLVLAGAWIGVRAWLAYGELQEARSGATELQQQFSADPTSMGGEIDKLGEHTKRAAGLTSDPIWRGAELLPWAGKNLEAFRVTAASLDTVVRSVGTPLASNADAVQQSLSFDGGRMDLAPLVSMQDASASADLQMKRVIANMSKIDQDALVPQLADAVDEFTELLHPVASGVGVVNDVSSLLPGMLGADGSRDTLLLFLNNAEVRSTVGIPGALALVNATDGKLTLAQQASSSDFPTYDEPVTQLPAEIRGVYGDKPALWIQNVTMLPEFPMTGELAATMWERNFGTRPQAVVTIDPVTLSYLLEATGPIELATGDVLTSDNAVDLLLHEVYLRYEDPRAQDAFFADASSRVFAAVSGGNFDAQKLVSALTQGAQEDRIKMWSSVGAEQSVIERTVLAGTLPQVADDNARFTMHLNDGTGAKMDYYLSTKVEMTGQACSTQAAAGELVVSYTMTNTAPADAGETLPKYITGGGAYDISPGSISTVARLFAPEGYTLRSQLVDGSAENAGESLSLFDRSVAQWNPVLAPGQSSTLELRYAAPQRSVTSVEWGQTPSFYHEFLETIDYGC